MGDSQFFIVSINFYLFSIFTNISKVLAEKDSPGFQDLAVGARALKACMDELTPKFDDMNDDRKREEWMIKIKEICSIVDHMKETADRETLNIWGRIQICSKYLKHMVDARMEPRLKALVIKKTKQLWMALKESNLKTFQSFDKFQKVLKNINFECAKLHFTGGVESCIRCEEIPRQAVALPCGHVGCQECLLEFMEARQGEKRCPVSRCKDPKIPDNFPIRFVCISFRVNEVLTIDSFSSDAPWMLTMLSGDTICSGQLLISFLWIASSHLSSHVRVQRRRFWIPY